MKEILNRLTNYETLTEKEASDIIIQISEGKLNTSEISSFLTIFMIRNITIEELSGVCVFSVIRQWSCNNVNGFRHNFGTLL